VTRWVVIVKLGAVLGGAWVMARALGSG
jgi:hypothetical protein